MPVNVPLGRPESDPMRLIEDPKTDRGRELRELVAAQGPAFDKPAALRAERDQAVARMHGAERELTTALAAGASKAETGRLTKALRDAEAAVNGRPWDQEIAAAILNANDSAFRVRVFVDDHAAELLEGELRDPTEEACEALRDHLAGAVAAFERLVQLESSARGLAKRAGIDKAFIVDRRPQVDRAIREVEQRLPDLVAKLPYGSVREWQAAHPWQSPDGRVTNSAIAAGMVVDGLRGGGDE
jgi:hypothetical protein